MRIGEKLAKLSAAKCAEMVGVTKRTIQNKIRSGKLSAIRLESGAYEIDLSEFLRVYPDAKAHENLPAKGGNNNTIDELSKVKIEALQREIELLKKQNNEALEREKDLLDTLKSNARLLEHQQTKRKRFLGIF